MHPYLPHTDNDIKSMLEAIGLESVDDLYSDVPESMRMKEALNLPKAKSEIEVRNIIGKLAKKNLSSADYEKFLQEEA